MLVAESLCWRLFSLCRWFSQCIKSVASILNRSPTSQTCHQHIWSSTSVTNIDVTIFIILISRFVDPQRSLDPWIRVADALLRRVSRRLSSNRFFCFLMKKVKKVITKRCVIFRLNSGINNRYNFLLDTIFLFSDYWNWLSKSRWIFGYKKFYPIPWEFGFENFAQNLK